jgi:hypothetical protein
VTHHLRRLGFLAMIFNRVVKNETGTTDCSAHEECLWYHYQYLTTQTKEKFLERCCCPAILCSMIGPFLSFSVGISLVVDIIFVIMLPHFHN